VVDYKGFHVDVANAMNQSLFEHVREFPELRANLKFVGTCQARDALYHSDQITSYLERLKAVNPDADDQKLLKFAKKMVKKPTTSGRVWASATDGSWGKLQGIAFNKKWAGDPGALVADLARCVASGFHPVGCDSIRSIVDHELGHQLDYLLKLRSQPGVMSMFIGMSRSGVIKAELSGYAATNVAEFLAEGWAEALNNATLRPVAARIGEIIRTEYRRKHG
jgi:hypothetical protein